MLLAIPGQTSVLLKKELMRIPILGTAMRLGKFIPVERGSQREAAKASVAAAAEALKSGLHILIFAEERGRAMDVWPRSSAGRSIWPRRPARR